jgi:broad specificity phosphatase PhoE
MSATEILLLRHAQSEGNENGRFGGHGPTPLTALGHTQAAATAKALAREGGLTAIFSSDLVRALETAQPICAATEIPLRATPALRERAVGLFTGLTFAEAEARHPVEFAAMMARDPGSCPPEGETAQACSMRAGAFVDATMAERTGERVLFVSHAFTINLLLRRLLGVESHLTFFRSDNCGLHRLKRLATGLWTVDALNDRRHL